MGKPSTRIRVPGEDIPPEIQTGFCVACRYKSSARGFDHLLEGVKDHAVWCETQRARVAAHAEAVAYAGES